MGTMRFRGNKLAECKHLIKEGWSLSYALGNVKFSPNEYDDAKKDPEFIALVEVKRQQWKTKYKNSNAGPRVSDRFIKANVKKQWGD
jgi:hypothetical protein